MNGYIDAHIHLDKYEEGERIAMAEGLERDGVDGLIAVSTDLFSCRQNLELARRFPRAVHPAFGYHPEQPIPAAAEREELLRWIREHRREAVAVGEVGLPVFQRIEAEARGEAFEMAPYLELLERFVLLARELELPIALHATQEEALDACGLLETHGVTNAHFHWFKGPPEAVERVLAGGYCISVPPEVVYDDEVRALVRRFPLSRLMAETDGPWPYEGPFEGMPTHPRMLRDVVRAIAEEKGIAAEEAAAAIRANTARFYRLEPRLIR